MAQGEFYVATSGPISSPISRPILLDGFALVVREPEMAALLVRQVRWWEARVFPAPLITRWAIPPIPANADGMLVHPSQVEIDLRTLSMYFFPEGSLRPAEREFLAARSTRRFLTLENRSTLRTPGQSPVPSARLQESSIVAELVSALPPPAPPNVRRVDDPRQRFVRRRK